MRGAPKDYAVGKAEATMPGDHDAYKPAEIAARRTLALRDGEPRPPFVTSVSELQRIFLGLFEQLSLHPARNPSPDRRPGIEWVGVFRRL